MPPLFPISQQNLLFKKKATLMSKLNNIIIHCSDSEWGCTREIRLWHLQRGFKDVGYHFVILNGKPLSKFFLAIFDGSVECGRSLDGDGFITGEEVGAHTLGYNDNSIGVCLIGVKSFTPSQISKLHSLLKILIAQYQIPIENILGHCETASGKKEGKTCPNLDVSKIREELRRSQK